MAEYKRIYFETVKRKWKELTGLTITGTISVFLLFWYLSSSGLITVNSYSYSQYCEGTEEDLCWAIINFTAKKDIYIYPLEYDPYGRNTPLEFNPGVKEWHLYRSWGKGWREINLSKTWSKKVNYAVKFAKGKTYLIKITALKNNPYWDNIKWSFTDALDPWWNSSWSYRQPINISNTAGDLTNYQVRIDLNSSNVGPNFNWSNNGSDIRFTNSTDDELNFWIESWNSETTTTYSFQKVHEKDLASEYGCWGNPIAVLKNSTTIIPYYQYPDTSNYSLYYTEYFFNNNTTGNTGNIDVPDSSRSLDTGISIKINDSFYVMSNIFHSISPDKKWVQLRNSTDGYNFSNIINDNVLEENSSKWASSTALKVSSSEVWFYITWYNDSSSEWAVYRFIYYINNGSVSTPQKLFTETGGELRSPFIFKDNNTYYLYYGIYYGTDSGLYVRSSSDGVNFGSRTQLLSGSGAWRNSIVKLVDGKYYMVVSADDDTNVKLYKGDSPTSLSFVKTLFSSAYQPYMLKINDSRVVIVYSGKSIEHIYASVWDLEQEQTPNSATIWVNVTSLPNNQNTTIYMYYGNSEASSASDGDGTFLFFDDFDTDTIGSKWQIQTDSSTLSDTSTSYAKINTTESRAEIDSVGWQVFVTKNYAIERPFAIESRVNAQGYGYYGGGIIWYDKGTNVNTNCEHAFADSDSLNLRHEDSGGSYTDYQGTSYSSEGNTWYVRNLILTSTQVISKTWTDNRNQDLGGYTLDNSANTGSKNIGLDHYVSGTSGTWAYFDWVFVRKYADPEPTISFGSEEGDTDPPTFSNWQQNPPDLNSSSVGKLYINVTITDDSGVNDSSVKFYHWINDSQYPNQPWCFINGTARDFECEHNMTNITDSVFNITLHTYAYNPSTHNVHPETMSSATKYNHSLSSNNKALKVRFYNISTHPNTTYILKSKLYRNSGDLLVYYCNSSYTSGKVYNSDYCVAITTLTSQEDTTYQNMYFYGDENSNLDGVKITSTGYIVFYALTGSDWNVEYANIDSNSVETTNNGGTGWTNQDFTPDVWIIQLNGNGLTTFGYKVYACDTLGNCGNSSIQEDTYAIANLPPSPAPEIIVPENSTYSGIFNITWTASKDPNGDPFNYSLYLYYSNGTLADVLADNNITEGTEYFTFDSTQYPDGQYYLVSNATDDAGNTNYYIMPYYFTLMNPPILKFKPPTEANGTIINRNWTEVNITIDESNLDTFDFDWDYTELDDYLVGYWRFDNNSAYGENNTHFYDYSGMGNNGTCSGGYCPTYVEGKKQLGLEFDGSNDYVSVSDDESLDITDKITIELWVYPEYTGDYQTLIHKGSSSNILGNEEFSYNVRRSPTNYIGFSLNIVGSGWNSVGGTQIPDNRWSYIVCTYNGSVMKVYKNGVLVGSKDTSGSIVSSDYNLKIGDTGNAGDPFNGTIDEVRIYNKSLSAEEIKQRYLSTRARYYDDSLVLALNFNNNSAIGENLTKAVDISKYGNDGTIHGATWTTGKFGKALNFDGVDDYVDCGNDSSIDITDPITIEAWVNVSSGIDGHIVSKRNGSSVQYVFYTLSGYLKLYGTSGNLVYNANIDDDQWHHVVGIINGADSRMYFDGNLVQTGTITSSNIPDAKLYIGTCYTFEPACLYKGKIDEVRIYNRALTGDEIKIHYLSEFQKYNSTQYRFYNNITDLEEGTYTYYGWANDSVGNEGQSEVREITIRQPDIKIEIWNGTDWILFNDTNLLEFRCEAGQTECEPTNQDAGNSLSIFKITNNGTGDGAKVEMKLNQTFTDITLKCDDDYTYADAVEITSSYQQIHGALSTNSYFYVSCWADYGTNPQPGYFDLHFQIS